MAVAGLRLTLFLRQPRLRKLNGRLLRFGKRRDWQQGGTLSSVEERLRALEARVEELESVESVRRLLARYCKALDERDADAMAPLWCRNAVVTVQPWNVACHGKDAIMQFFSEYFRGPWIEPRHNYCNENIESDADNYKSFCYFHETLSREEHSVVGWGTWTDRFSREDGVWKFSRRDIYVMALTPISRGWAMQDKIMPLG